ncbi:hypothetical protein ACFWBB_13550, partial [Streptomyces sp. NPDC060000]
TQRPHTPAPGPRVPRSRRLWRAVDPSHAHPSAQRNVPVPVRPVRLIAEGCAPSRAEAERLITEGKLVSAVRLSGRLSGDFTFTLKR